MKTPGKPTRKDCDPEEKPDVSGTPRVVVAKIPQGFDTNINIRIVPGRDTPFADIPKRCRPRQGAPRRDADPLDLPPDLVARLRDADDAVVAWLAKDEANAQLFMARPAEALAKAGVKLKRADLKRIARNHNEVKEAAVVAPGVNVRELKVSAFPKGKVGELKPSRRSGEAQHEPQKGKE